MRRNLCCILMHFDAFIFLLLGIAAAWVRWANWLMRGEVFRR
jgi:hypothetical protein